ncbi:MAG: hypothetical protein ACRD2C_12835 [Acidimicrobiales bacterium]
MAPASDNDPPEAGREEAARAVAAGMVGKFADETKAWITKSAGLVEECLDRAQSKQGFTADELVKQVTAMWAVNLEYLGKLVSIAVPGEAPTGEAPADEAATDEEPENPRAGEADQ